jgi:hypothetical protein
MGKKASCVYNEGENMQHKIKLYITARKKYLLQKNIIKMDTKDN